METVQVLWVPHELMPDPVHPPKPKPAAGVAVSVTCGFPVKLAEQVPGQLIPAGLLVIVPVPAPATFTVSCETPFTSPWHPPSKKSKKNKPRTATSLRAMQGILNEFQRELGCRAVLSGWLGEARRRS